MRFQGLKRYALLIALLPCSTQVFAQGISVDLGKTTTGRYMNLVGNTPGSDGEITDMIFVSPEYAARNKGTSMYFNIDDSFFYKLPAGQFVIVNVEYYDAPGVQIKLVYDAAGKHDGKEHPESITTTGSNKWKSKRFIIDDAYFGNGLGHGADLKLVAAADTMTINAVSVVPFEAYFNYGAINDSLYIRWANHPSGDSYTQIVAKEGEECVATIRNDNYLYVDVNDSFMWGGNHPYLFVSVEYYDADTTLGFRLQYDAVGWNIFKPTPYVYCKGWNSFRTHTFEISDALFQNRMSGLADFRLHIPTQGMAINQILIARLPKMPLPTITNIANFTAWNALESPTFALSQNYPNPFNPSTKIQFSIPSASFVSLKVFNVLGAEIATLVNENKAPGTHQVTWDANGYPSAVYFCRLQTRQTDGGQAGGFTQTKKLVLVR